MINPEQKLTENFGKKYLTHPEMLSDIVVEIEFSVVFFVRS